MKHFRSPSFPSRSSLRRQSGVTLIEIMVVMAIMGILLGIALPALRDMINTEKVRSATNDLYVSLMFARSEAMKRNANVVVAPVTAGTSSWAEGWTVAPASTPGTPSRVQDAIPAVSITATAASITYRGSGRQMGTPCFLVTHANDVKVQARAVTIDISGRPAVRGTSC